MTEIVEVPHVQAPDHQVKQLLVPLEEAVLTELAKVGLPHDGIFVPVDQRGIVLDNFHNVISSINFDDRGRAVYLSKFVAAIAAGLFDAALNYLWDETVAELRRRVTAYDLNYFFDVAVASPERRKNLSNEEDLSRLGDDELIRGTKAIALISDVGYRQLDLIRHMRNHASAAHPNQNDLSAFGLLGFAETCIREVIQLPMSSEVAETKRLLTNVRYGKIDSASARMTAQFFTDLHQHHADKIAAGLFGIYIDSKSREKARDSVRVLLPELWPLVSEEQRQQFGIRYARSLANGDTEEANHAREFLDIVDGSAYLPEQVRVVELMEAIESLLTAHRGYNNFHTEPAFARHLAALASEPVPLQVQYHYVTALVEVFLSNGHGIAWSANPHYKSMIEQLSSDEAEIAVVYLFEEEIQSRLRWSKSVDQYKLLTNMLHHKLTRPVARDLMLGIKDFNGSPSDLAKDSELKRLLARVKRT